MIKLEHSFVYTFTMEWGLAEAADFGIGDYVQFRSTYLV